MPGLSSLHGIDLIVVLVVALLVFGPKRLPEMGSAVGKTFKEFRKSMSEITEHKSEPAPAPVEQQIAAAPVAATPIVTPVATETTAATPETVAQ